MKVQNITDIEGFFKAIDSCKGKVELVTGEGRQTESEIKIIPVCITRDYFFKWRDSGIGNRRT